MKITRIKRTFFLLLAFGLVGIAPVQTASGSNNRVLSGFQLKQDTGKTSIEINTAQAVRIKHAMMGQSRRMWLDLSPAILTQAQQEKVQDNQYITSVKMNQFSIDPPTVRLVADLKQGVDYRVIRQPGKNKVIIEVQGINQKTPVISTKKNVRAPKLAENTSKLIGVISSSELQSNRTSQGDETPSGVKINLDFRNTDIHDVLKALSVQSGANIIVSEAAKGNITITLRGTSVEEALQMIARMGSLEFKKINNSYLVGSLEEIRRTAAVGGPTEVYVLQTLKTTNAISLLQNAFPYLTVQGQDQTSTLVITGDAADVRNALTILRQVDGTPGTSGAIFVSKTSRVITLSYLNAARAVESLTKLFPDLNVVVGPEPFSPPAASFNPLMISGNSNRNTSSSGNNRNSNNTNTMNTGNTGQSSQVPSDGIRSKTLILYGTSDLVEKASSILKEMDVAPPQVMIEAKVVDISPEATKDLGLEWSWGTSDEPDSGKISIVEPVTPDPTGQVPLENITHKLGFGEFGRIPSIINAKLNALVKDKQANVLASPKIAVLDNEEANIFIGDVLRFSVVQEITATGTVKSIEEFPVGIALLVRPRVNADGLITMKIHPVVSRITSYIDGLPSVGSRESDSTIRVKEGETVVIGGLLQDEDINVMSKVPFLGDLPLVKELFRNRSTSHKKTEITIFITPKIMK